MKKYKAINANALMLESTLNDLAQQGWTVAAAAPGSGFGVVVILEKSA